MNEVTQLDSGQIESLKNKLSENTKELYFTSETDASIEVVEISGENVQSALKAESGSPEGELTETKIEDFLAMYGTEKDWQNPIQKDFARKFGGAVRLLQEELPAVKVFRVGGTRANLYIIGQLTASNWLGLKTSIVET